jgi:hypothetical protein
VGWRQASHKFCNPNSLGILVELRLIMNGLEGVPEWFSGAVVGAVLAALGYIAKLAIEQWRLIHAARASRLACLAELSSLLRAGWASFAIQNEHAQQFVRALNRERCADIAEDGYEQSMVDAFPNFGPAERELHAIIRGITIHSLRVWRENLQRSLATLKRTSSCGTRSMRRGFRIIPSTRLSILRTRRRTVWVSQ